MVVSECSRHSVADASSPVPGLFVGFDLQAIVELVKTDEEIDDGHEFENALVVKAQLPHRGSVDGYSVVTP